MTTTVTKVMYTETAHRLTDYDGKCSHFHGHSYRWEVTVSAENLDHRGMVVDFADLKTLMSLVIQPLDHAVVLHDQDPLVTAGRIQLDRILMSTKGEPARLHIVDFNPTAENLAAWIAAQLITCLGLGIRLSHIKVWETANSFVVWRNHAK